MDHLESATNLLVVKTRPGPLTGMTSLDIPSDSHALVGIGHALIALVEATRAQSAIVADLIASAKADAANVTETREV